jgi:hypothetical protein
LLSFAFFLSFIHGLWRHLFINVAPHTDFPLGSHTLHLVCSSVQRSRRVGTFTLTVIGANFSSDSAIEVDGVKETTTYVSCTQLTTTIPASHVASGAQLQVQVPNGSVTSGTSNGNDITVTNPAPVIVSLTPSTIDKTFHRRSLS